MAQETQEATEHTFVRLRIPVSDLADLKKVAAREFDGVVSIAMRRAIREYVGRHQEAEQGKEVAVA